MKLVKDEEHMWWIRYPEAPNRAHPVLKKEQLKRSYLFSLLINYNDLLKDTLSFSLVRKSIFYYFVSSNQTKTKQSYLHLYALSFLWICHSWRGSEIWTDSQSSNRCFTYCCRCAFTGLPRRWPFLFSSMSSPTPYAQETLPALRSFTLMDSNRRYLSFSILLQTNNI